MLNPGIPTCDEDLITLVFPYPFDPEAYNFLQNSTIGDLCIALTDHQRGEYLCL